MILFSKKGAAAILALLLCLTVLPLPTAALKGDFEGVSWEIREGTLTVFGGDIPDTSASAVPPWQKFADSVTSLVIGEGVSSIGQRAFEDMDSLAFVDLGKANFVGRLAFSGCAALREITFPEGVYSIGDFALAECTSLERICLPASLIQFGFAVTDTTPALREIISLSPVFLVESGALIKGDTLLCFPQNSPVTTPVLPETVTAVAAGAFRDCFRITSVEMPGVRVIGDSAFSGCLSLTETKMGAVSVIGDSAFFGCAALGDIVLPPTLEELGDYAFKYCSSLCVAAFDGGAPRFGAEVFFGTHPSFTLTIPAEAEGWGEGDSFMGYPMLRQGIYGGGWEGLFWELDTRSGLLAVSGEGALPDLLTPADAPWYLLRRAVRHISVEGPTRVGDNCFRYCSAETVSLSPSVKEIGSWAFSACASLRLVEAPGVELLGEGAFFGCGELAGARFGPLVLIGKQCFAACISLDTLTLGSATAPVLGEWAFDRAPVTVLHPPGATGFDGEMWSGISVEGYLPGDVNGDAAVNLFDVSTLLKGLAGWDVQVQPRSSDYNGDGQLNLLDASLILKKIAGWE